jgi:5'-nucleotidase (lipoprotein e(P4) family)
MATRVLISRLLFCLTAITATTNCAARSTAPTSASVPAAQSSSSGATNDNLNAVVWVQTSVEYEASARQAYQAATRQLDAALAAPRWTAALEQTADPSALPPAVILDIDETVLDNSYYQARLIRDGGTFAADTWDRWCEEARATAIPGAREFTQYAASRGVTVFYVTNRTAGQERATRANLSALGFPVQNTTDTVLTRGERPEWQASGKGPRRTFVANGYRILLLVGDDLGDFIADASGTPEERSQRTASQQEWWGQRWFMLPNPTYGSWERAVIGSSPDPTAAKRNALRYEPR